VGKVDILAARDQVQHDPRSKIGDQRNADLAGVAVLGAYTLVFMAMQRSPVSYVGSVRGMSVVLTAWVGSAFLGKGKTGLRVTASALVVLDIMLIAVGG